MKQTSEDEKNLRLLSIFHYVLGGLAGLFSLLPFIHLAIGLAMIYAPGKMSSHGNMPPAFAGWIFVAIASCLILFGWTLALCIILTGRYLARRKKYQFCLVIGGVECLFIPIGTILGVFSLIVLTKSSVKELFQQNRPEATRLPHNIQQG